MQPVHVLLPLAVGALASNAALAQGVPDEGWLKARDVQRLAQEEEDRGRLPVAIECRHDPTEDPDLVKPQVRMRWAPNPERVRWRFKVAGRSRANDLLRAAYRQQGFDLVSRDTFQTGATDQMWMCEIWHKPR